MDGKVCTSKSGKNNYFELMRKFSNDLKIKVSRSPKRKGHGRLIAAAMYVLLLDLGRFRHVLEVSLKKKVISC